MVVLQDPNVKIIRELREEIDRLRAMIGGNIVSKHCNDIYVSNLTTIDFSFVG